MPGSSAKGGDRSGADEGEDRGGDAHTRRGGKCEPTTAAATEWSEARRAARAAAIDKEEEEEEAAFALAAAIGAREGEKDERRSRASIFFFGFSAVAGAAVAAVVGDEASEATRRADEGATDAERRCLCAEAEFADSDRARGGRVEIVVAAPSDAAAEAASAEENEGNDADADTDTEGMEAHELEDRVGGDAEKRVLRECDFAAPAPPRGVRLCRSGGGGEDESLTCNGAGSGERQVDFERAFLTGEEEGEAILPDDAVAEEVKEEEVVPAAVMLARYLSRKVCTSSRARRRSARSAMRRCFAAEGRDAEGMTLLVSSALRRGEPTETPWCT